MYMVHGCDFLCMDCELCIGFIHKMMFVHVSAIHGRSINLYNDLLSFQSAFCVHSHHHIHNNIHIFQIAVAILVKITRIFPPNHKFAKICDILNILEEKKYAKAFQFDCSFQWSSSTSTFISIDCIVSVAFFSPCHTNQLSSFITLNEHFWMKIHWQKVQSMNAHDVKSKKKMNKMANGNKLLCVCDV